MMARQLALSRCFRNRQVSCPILCWLFSKKELAVSKPRCDSTAPVLSHQMNRVFGTALWGYNDVSGFLGFFCTRALSFCKRVFQKLGPSVENIRQLNESLLIVAGPSWVVCPMSTSLSLALALSFCFLSLTHILSEIILYIQRYDTEDREPTNCCWPIRGGAPQEHFSLSLSRSLSLFVYMYIYIYIHIYTYIYIHIHIHMYIYVGLTRLTRWLTSAHVQKLLIRRAN